MSPKTTTSEKLETSTQVNGVAAPAELEGLVDGDTHLAKPPHRPSGILLVRLVASGRSRPLPATDPAAE